MWSANALAANHLVAKSLKCEYRTLEIHNNTEWNIYFDKGESQGTKKPYIYHTHGSTKSEVEWQSW